MSALTDRLRADADRMGAPHRINLAHEAAEMLDAIDALHQPIEGQDEYLRPEPWCPACANPWPCNTHRLLHPEGEPT